MNNFDKFNRIRNNADRNTLNITNESEVSGDNGFKFFHILWLYPDVLNIHGGRGDIIFRLKSNAGIPCAATFRGSGRI